MSIPFSLKKTKRSFLAAQLRFLKKRGVRKVDLHQTTVQKPSTKSGVGLKEPKMLAIEMNASSK